MKRVFAVCMVLALMLTGCGAAESDAAPAGDASAPSVSSAAPAEDAMSKEPAEEAPAEDSMSQEPAEEAAAEGSTLTGTLDEVKDTMFVVTDANGDSFAFTIGSEKPAGLDQVSIGDKVTVTYTGEVSVVDAFTGTVLSVEAAQ